MIITSKAFLSVVLFLLLTSPSLSQSDCDHRTANFDRFDHTKVTLPAQVTYFDGRKISILETEETEHVLHTRTKDLYRDQLSELPENFNKDFKKGKWWILYCDKDNYVYVIAKVLPSQIKKK